MKKSILIIIAAVLSIAAVAQPRAIGGRIELGGEVSYQHNVGSNFAELDFGYNYATGFGITATYDFIFASPEWTPKGTWDWYAGPGLTMGTYFSPIPFSVGICAQVGLSYTFWFPLQLSVDLRPVAAVGFNSDGARFNTKGLYGFIPTFGVRYCFGMR